MVVVSNDLLSAIMELSIAGDEWILGERFPIGPLWIFFVKCYGSCCLCVSWEIAVEEGGSYAANQKSYLISNLGSDRTCYVELNCFYHCEFVLLSFVENHKSRQVISSKRSVGSFCSYFLLFVSLKNNLKEKKITSISSIL